MKNQIDVIGIGHLGHAHDCQKKREEEKEKEEEEEGKSSSVVPHARYSLDDQIEHKKEFLRSLPYSHIILAGHSIGAFICLEVFSLSFSLSLFLFLSSLSFSLFLFLSKKMLLLFFYPFFKKKNSF